MKNCNSTWLNGRPLLGDLKRRLGDRVRVANDADCFALSESVDGAAAGTAASFGVILGTGVGGGIVAHGRLIQGPNGIAGEWGHTPLPYFHRDVDELEHRLADRPCYCGRVNCVETVPVGSGPCANSCVVVGRTARAAGDRAGNRSKRETHTRVVLPPARQVARANRQYSRSGCDRARRRRLRNTGSLSPGSRALDGVLLFRHREYAPGSGRTWRVRRRSRRGVVVARRL